MFFDVFLSMFFVFCDGTPNQRVLQARGQDTKHGVFDMPSDGNTNERVLAINAERGIRDPSAPVIPPHCSARKGDSNKILDKV